CLLHRGRGREPLRPPRRRAAAGPRRARRGQAGQARRAGGAHLEPAVHGGPDPQGRRRLRVQDRPRAAPGVVMARRSPPVTEVEPPSNALERLVERALAAGAARAGSQVEKIRRASPDATPAELLATLERGFRRRVGALSAAVGLSAAVPGAGTVLAVALTGV